MEPQSCLQCLVAGNGLGVLSLEEAVGQYYGGVSRQQAGKLFLVSFRTFHDTFRDRVCSNSGLDMIRLMRVLDFSLVPPITPSPKQCCSSQAKLQLQLGLILSIGIGSS